MKQFKLWMIGIALTICPTLSINSATFNQGTIYIKNGVFTTVEMPQALINEYKNYGTVPYSGGGSISWSTNNSCLVIGTTWMYSCTIMPRNGSTFADNVQLTCQFYSWHGTSLMDNKIVWNVKLETNSGSGNIKEMAVDPKTLTLEVGETYPFLSGMVWPLTMENYRNTKWLSDNEAVASFVVHDTDQRSSGTVTANKIGNANIIYEATDGSGVQAVCAVTVVPKNGKFTCKTEEGVDMNFYVISQEEKTCGVGKSSSGDDAIDKSTKGTITIPSIVEGYTVTEISRYAFRNCSSITTVNLPHSLSKIRDYAFEGCTSLSQVNGTDNIEYLEPCVFDKTPWYDALPEGLVYIGKVLYAYKGEMPSETTVKVREGTKSITDNAFYTRTENGWSSNHGLVAIEIPASVTQIGYDDQYWYEEYFMVSEKRPDIFYCPNLQSIIVDSQNERYESPGGCNAIIDKTTNFMIHASNATAFIPSSVKGILPGAFYGLDKITTLNIPDNVEYFGGISYCTNLESVYVGKGVKGYGWSRGNQKLSSISVSPQNPYFDSRNNCNAVIEKETGKLIWGCSTTVIPADVTEIGNSAFNGMCDQEVQVMVIPDKVEIIGNGAFDDFIIKNIVIGKGIKQIRNFAFYSWRYSMLAKNVSIYCLSSNPAELESDNSFSSSLYSGATLYVPKGSKSTYASANIWNKFEKILEFDPTTFNPDDLKKIEVTELLLDVQEFIIEVGETKQIKVTVSPEDATDNTVTWSSSDTSVAKVSGSGIVTAVAAGSATIICKANDGSGVSATCFVTVTDPAIPVSSIMLNRATLSLETGQEETLTAIVKPDDATDKTVTWSSSNAGVATVDSNGKVTAVVAGSATITCTANDGSGVQATCTVAVTSPKADKIVLPTEAQVKAGQTITLTPAITPANVETTLTWTSDDESIATVNSDGVVTGVKKGQTFINVMTDNGKYGWCKVTVTAPEPTAITLPNTVTVHVGETITLTPTLTPADAEAVLSWLSYDEGVAKVNDSGKLIGVAEGLTVITVSTANGLTSNPCKVTVTPDPSGITDTQMGQTQASPVFSLSGRRLTAPKKGVNIVGGRKVIVR